MEIREKEERDFDFKTGKQVFSGTFVLSEHISRCGSLGKKFNGLK